MEKKESSASLLSACQMFECSFPTERFTDSKPQNASTN